MAGLIGSTRKQEQIGELSVPLMYSSTRLEERQQPRVQENMPAQHNVGLANADADADVVLFEMNSSNGACTVPANNSVAEEDSAVRSAYLQKQKNQKQSSRSSILRDSSFLIKGNANPTTGAVQSAFRPNQRNLISRCATNDIKQGHNVHSPSQSGSVLMNKIKNEKLVVPDSAACVSRETGTSSFFTSTSSKLKGYLNLNKKQESHQEAHFMSSFDRAQGGNVSGSNTPKHRSATSKKKCISSVDSLCRRTSDPGFGHGKLYDYKDSDDVQSYTKFSSNQSCTSAMDETAVSSYSVKTKHNIAVNDGASVQSKQLTKTKCEKQTASQDSIMIQVFDLPWIDNRPGSNLQGRYSGPVDESLQPNGRGTIILRGNETLQFQGIFEHGSLMSHLTCDKERPPPTITARVERRISVSSIRSTNTDRTPREPPGRTIDHSSSDYEQKKKAEKKGHMINTSLVQRKFSSEISDNQGNVASSSNEERRDKKISPSTSSKSINEQNSNQQSKKSKPRYNLGDVARTPKHMIIHRSNTEAIHSASRLKQYEQAFLKRSNGLWTVAILADRSLQPIKRYSSHWYSEMEIDLTTMELEESMLFVLNEHGATKSVPRKHWGSFVRRMNIHAIEQIVTENGVGKRSSG